MALLPVSWKGSPRRTADQQIALATRIMDQEHEQDVIDRCRSSMGGRYSLLLPPDLTRNTLRAYCDRVGRAYFRPPLASGLTESLARVLGDHSATTTIARYAAAGGRPLPTPMTKTGTEALAYRLGVGYAGLRLGWSARERRLYEEVIAPDDLDLEYGSDSPTEPTVIRHRGRRVIGGSLVEVVEVYDLADIEAPSYRVIHRDRDVTAEVHGRRYEGDGYPWRDEGVPYHPVVITGDDRSPYRTLPLVEASLLVAVRWSAWGAGTDHASHPQRNVRGLYLAGMDSDASAGDQGDSGIAVGPETVLRWVDDDPQRPGDHWQDAPAYDPETLARAIRIYELSALAALGLPIDYEATGGEPTAREAEALAEVMAGTYSECRRFDGERLRRASAMARALAADGLIEPGDYPPGPFGLLYREEIAEALEAPRATTTDDEEEENDDGTDGRGDSGGADSGGNPENADDGAE